MFHRLSPFLPVSTIVVLSIALFSSAAAAEDVYIVEAGDTLSHIALRSGVSVELLVETNGLDNADQIRSGVKLRIPAAGGGSDATVDYVVQSGDTLSEVAARAGVSTAVLVDLNGLSDRHHIRVGQVLQVPGGQISSVGTANYPKLPDRIVSAPERLALVAHFEHWAAANGIPVDLLMSIAWQESGWNNSAVSSVGAMGVGQIMPATGAWVAADLIGVPELDASVPEENIRISARYVRYLLDYLGDEDLAIASYFQGPGSVRTGELLPATEHYVDSVQVHRQFFLSK